MKTLGMALVLTLVTFYGCVAPMTLLDASSLGIAKTTSELRQECPQETAPCAVALEALNIAIRRYNAALAAEQAGDPNAKALAESAATAVAVAAAGVEAIKAYNASKPAAAAAAQ